jgi:hypothetical protein
MSNKKTCKDLIQGRLDSRNEMISQMLIHHTGQFSDHVDELAEQFVEEFTKTYENEPSEDEVDKFKQNIFENTEYNEYSLMEFPLGHSVEKVVKIEMSTGGPADFIMVWVDQDDNSINRIVYHYQDWFDGASVDVKETDPIWEFAELYIELISL